MLSVKINLAKGRRPSGESRANSIHRPCAFVAYYCHLLSHNQLDTEYFQALFTSSSLTVHGYMAFSITCSLPIASQSSYMKCETQNDPPLAELRSMEQHDVLDGENKRLQIHQHDQGAMASWT